MHRVSPSLRRPSAAVLLLLQLAVAGVGTSHAVATLNGAPTPHVEHPDRSDGRAAHDHGSCAICQASATAVLLPVPPGANLAPELVAGGRPRDPAPAPRRGTLPVGHPRAPPRVTD